MTNLSTTERDILYYMEEMVNESSVLEVRRGRLQNLAQAVGIDELQLRISIVSLVRKGLIEKVNKHDYMLI